jgi:2-keto-4-pentenoate hydratase/2-oxohepta-3-ene-1,7-dioic acid hydratase in catechol pathway
MIYKIMDYLLLRRREVRNVGSSETRDAKDGSVRLGAISTGDGATLAIQDAGTWYRCVFPHGAIAPASVLEVLALGDQARAGAAVQAVRVLPPLLPHRNVICLGKNYREHAMEFSAYAGEADSIPEAPIVFTKAAAALCGPADDITVDSEVTAALDYEVELGVVIGVGGRDIQARDALAHVAGYTIVNDTTARDLQQRHKQWFLGKSLVGATPTGPVIVSADELTPLAERSIRSWINGELRQDATLGEMLFGIPETIAQISRIFPLEPGDLIAMGTPSGVGVGFDPPRFLQDGDRVVCEIEGIGRLDNTVRFVSAPNDAVKEAAHA